MRLNYAKAEKAAEAIRANLVARYDMQSKLSVLENLSVCDDPIVRSTNEAVSCLEIYLLLRPALELSLMKLTTSPGDGCLQRLSTNASTKLKEFFLWMFAPKTNFSHEKLKSQIKLIWMVV